MNYSIKSNTIYDTSSNAFAIAINTHAAELDNFFLLKHAQPTVKIYETFLEMLCQVWNSVINYFPDSIRKTLTLNISKSNNVEVKKIHPNIIEIETIGDALRYFGLYSCLEELDSSLEDVRRHKKTENDHEECLKEIDKKIQKLSLKYHPDRVRNRGGTEDEITTAKSFQTVINAIRTVIKYLNAAFLEDIHIDQKFEFYTKFNICSLNNENDVISHVYYIKFRIDTMSRIKQQNIILQIREFLITSKRCVDCYLQGCIHEFAELCYSSLFHLNCSIKGYKILCMEINEMLKKCKDEHMLYILQNIERDSKRDLKLLELLEKTAKSSLKGKYQFFSTEEFMDPYLIRPFVCYVNIILMCNVMVRGVSLSLFEKWKLPFLYNWKFNDELSELKPLYDLAASYIYKQYEELKFQRYYKLQMSEIEIQSKFCEILDDINKDMEVKFNVDYYSETKVLNSIWVRIENCKTMMNDIKQMVQQVSKNVEELLKEFESIWLNIENCKLMMNEIEKKVQQVSNNIEEFHKKSEKMVEKLEEILRISAIYRQYSEKPNIMYKPNIIYVEWKK